MLSCKEITEQANEFLEKELPFLARMRFYIHLFMCDHCKRYVQQLKTTILTLGKMGSPPPADNQEIARVVEHICQHTKTSK